MHPYFVSLTLTKRRQGVLQSHSSNSTAITHTRASCCKCASRKDLFTQTSLSPAHQTLAPTFKASSQIYTHTPSYTLRNATNNYQQILSTYSDLNTLKINNPNPGYKKNIQTGRRGKRERERKRTSIRAGGRRTSAREKKKKRSEYEDRVATGEL